MPSLIIAGGRDWVPKPDSMRLVIDIIQRYHIDEIVSGGCHTGADRFGENAAKALGLKLKIIEADWSLGKIAGPLRNKKLAEYADGCILFKGGRGTASMKREALNAGIPIYYEET